MGDWNKLMAKELVATDEHLTEQAYELILEAAGELKCVALKVALGRAIELLNASLTSGDNSHFNQSDINEFRKLVGIAEQQEA